jgi:hypothetical protein
MLSKHNADHLLLVSTCLDLLVSIFYLGYWSMDGLVDAEDCSASAEIDLINTRQKMPMLCVFAGLLTTYLGTYGSTTQ